MPATVQPESILKELGRLWVDLGKDDPSGVLRACAMTLIVAVDEERDPQSTGETIALLMHEHPSRAIVVRVQNRREPALQSRVFAQCWRPFGRRQQICCEQIEITCSLASLADAPAVLRGLIVPDLPVVLYCPSESLWQRPEFSVLLPLATKLIVDSTNARSPAGVLAYMNSLPQPVRRADLSWSRLTPWRESIAQLFEDPDLARKIYDLQEIRMLYSGAEAPSSVYYLAGWFMHVLGAGVHLKIAPGVSPSFASIVQIALIADEVRVTVELTEANAVEVSVNEERRQLTVYPDMGECDALREELSVTGRDRVFEDVLGLANLMLTES
jgi:glucose-6-phosphate dehydrogenase assembly protein OpcA